MSKFKRKLNNLFKKIGSNLKSLLSYLFYGFIFIIIFISILFIYFAKDLPNPQKISQQKPIESTKIYDRTGKIILYDIHSEEKRTIVNFDQISDNLKNATLTAEDANFYYHFGIDFKGFIRAILENLKGHKVGGSTITQQYIKNSFLTPEKTFTRKIKELILSLEMEIIYSKNEIFNFYLNQVPYGSNAYGIEAASQTFFNKSAKDLTLSESALLAVLPQAPTYYSPFGSHPEELKNKQEYILDRMILLNYINKEQSEQAKQEKLNFNKTSNSIKAPHFVMYIKEYLENKYGQEFIEKSGLKVQTTLDWELQETAENIILEGAKNNEKNFKSYNSALVAIDPKTGQILTMVGSRDYFEDSLPIGCISGKNCKFDPNVNVTIRERQPGSSFKPFAYAAAFEKGYTPNTILFDLETEFSTEEGKSYKPQNYDGNFRGPVSIREALAQSLNIPSVKVLYLAGINKTINLSQEMGITTLKQKEKYGLSLVLGGGEVKLLDEVAAYGVFANQGIKNNKTAILKIEDNKGNIIEKFEEKPVKILEPQVANLINDILSDNQARTPIFGNNSPLYFQERPVAAKTGTTQEYRDAWTIGYTPSLVVGVWSGNNDNSPMAKAGAGLYAAAPLWNDFIKKAYQLKIKDKQSESEFTLPPEIENFNKSEIIITNKSILDGNFENEIKIKIDKISQKIATEFTPPELIEEKIYKEIHSILYYIDKNNPLGEKPINPENDSQFYNWENPVLEWAKKISGYNQKPPIEYDDIHIKENQPFFIINSPLKNSIINSNLIEIKIEPIAPLGIKQIDIFLDDNFIGIIKQSPYNFNLLIPLEIKKGTHLLKIKLYDNILNFKEEEITIFINK